MASPRFNQRAEQEPAVEIGRRVTVRLPEADYQALEAEVLRRSLETGKLLNFSVIWRECVQVYLSELERRKQQRG